MRRITYFFLLCATIAQAQPSVTGSTRIKVNEGNNTWITTLDNLLSGRMGVDSTFAKTDGTYAGKRIGDNAYKHGTLSVRSTDTTGILNVYNNSTTKPGIYLRYNDASTNGFNVWKIDPDNQTNNSTVGSFNFYATNFDGVNVPYSTRANHVWRMGYNTTAGGGREVSTDADLHIAYESMYYNVYTTGRRKRSWEWHLQSQDTLGGVHRVISTIGSHDGKDGEFSVATNRFSLIPYTASSTWLDMDYINKNTYLDSMRIYFNEPQVAMPFLSFRDAANTRYYKMFESDASDRLIINSQGNGLVIGAPTTQFPTSGLLYTSDASALRIGATGNRSGLDIFSNSDEALRLRGPNETTGWNLRPESAEFVLQSPAGVGTVYVHESAPATSIYVESTTGDVGFRITNPTARIHSYSSSGATQAMFRQENSTGSNALYRSNATPDGAITANPGDLAQTSISSLGELYLKETGTGNTGWKPVLTAYKVTKAVPTTLNATQEVGIITHNDGGRSALVQIDAVVAASGFAMQKRYIIPMGFSSTGGVWNILVPENAAENASWAGSNNFNLEMRTNTSGSPSGGVDTLRITRIAGSSAANCILTIQILSQGANTTFASTTATGTSSTTTLYAQNAIAQINNKVGINNIAPARTLHVTGEARITDLTTDAPTELLGADGDGDLAIVAKSAELTIATGTLKLAQQGATTGQVLEWNGSAWAPATDDTGGGGGSSFYQTVRDDGAGMTQRAALNFVSSATVTAAATDDSGNNETEITLTVPTDGITATELAANSVSTSEIATDGVGTAEVQNGAITYAKIQDIASQSLIGNSTGATAVPQAVTLGTGLGWSGTTITNTGDTDAADDAPVGANYLVTSLSATLTNDRAATGGTNISTTDAGANSTFTIAALSGTTSPTSITSDQDNYNPTSWSSSTTVRVSGDATTRAITGFSALSENTIRRIVNAGSNYIYVPAEHPDSDAANRVAGAEDYIIPPGGVLTIFYDGTSSRWRVEKSTFTMTDIGVKNTGLYYNVTAASTSGGDHPHAGFAFSGTSASNQNNASSTTLPNSWGLTTGSTATGASNVYLVKNNVTFTAFGSGHLAGWAWVSLPALSTGTQRYTAQLSITPTASSATTLNVNNSVGIRYTDNVLSGNWQLFSRDNAGSESTADSGVAVSANGLYLLRVYIDEARSEARYYINDAFVGRITGNMPNAAACGVRFIITKSVGTTASSASVVNIGGAATY